MNAKLDRLLELTELVLMDLEHQIPPEAVAVAELRRLLDEINAERQIPEPSAYPGPSLNRQEK